MFLCDGRVIEDVPDPCHFCEDCSIAERVTNSNQPRTQLKITKHNIVSAIMATAYHMRHGLFNSYLLTLQRVRAPLAPVVGTTRTMTFR